MAQGGIYTTLGRT